MKVSNEAIQEFAGIVKTAFKEAFDEAISETLEDIKEEDSLAPGTIVKNEMIDQYRIIKEKRGDAYLFTNGACELTSLLKVITPIEGPAQVGDKIIITKDYGGMYKVGDVTSITEIFRKTKSVRTKLSGVSIPNDFYKIIERPDPRTQDPAIQKRREIFENAGRELEEFKEGDVGRAPGLNKFTWIGPGEILRGKVYFGEGLGSIDLTEVIPVCFVDDRLDQ